MIYYENTQPSAEANYAVNGVAFATNKPATFGSTVAATGAVTLASTLNVTGAVVLSSSLAVTGAITGPRVGNVVITAASGATVVLTAALSGTTYIMSATGGTPIFTLPAVASGLEFTFICANTTTGMAINTGTTALIHAKTANAGTAITSTATSGSLINTQGTAIVGDAIKLVCDGVGWWPASQTGIFSVT
jgi:hypothetical protein